jgi:hypothetical protein
MWVYLTVSYMRYHVESDFENHVISPESRIGVHRESYDFKSQRILRIIISYRDHHHIV